MCAHGQEGCATCSILLGGLGRGGIEEVAASYGDSMSLSSDRILLVGSPVQTSIEQMYFRAFQANGYNRVDLLDVEAGLPSMFRTKLVAE